MPIEFHRFAPSFTAFLWFPGGRETGETGETGETEIEKNGIWKVSQAEGLWYHEFNKFYQFYQINKLYQFETPL